VTAGRHGLAAVPGREARTLVRPAGTVTTVTALLWGSTRTTRSASTTPGRLRRGRKVTADLLAMTVAQRLALPVMHPGRAT